MRLPILDAYEAPSVVRRLLGHRPGYFGDAFCQALEVALRGPSSWSVGERELFAAYVSARNDCVF